MTSMFGAHHVRWSDDGDVLVLAFADDQRGAGGYVLLQRSKQVSQEERNAGEHRIYIEVDDQSRSCYGGIVKARVHDGAMELRFTPECAARLRTDDVFTIRGLTAGDIAMVQAGLRALFIESPEVLGC